ncbi:hypothetical protein POJ06DRAFT_266018 [Lipomyces tetrasporus]|uniref:F-box domain-containing protein n=1 Tax=Lipomyces tetrasporus TaxID=54092 RepID=A0AAD7QY60_9ASCO|nr:uncharacterized protein POJ06DRAFT_266018 [Lipomyces tetrasporus]KAJ8103161.1 hypothetical protein POJ06DRAFT_266018 [Lipomyces tetrasporus]
MPSFDDLPIEINEIILQHAEVLTSSSGIPRLHSLVDYTRDVRFNYSEFSLVSRKWRDVIQCELFRHPVLVVDHDSAASAPRVFGLCGNLGKAERIYLENPELARYAQGADVKFVPSGCPGDPESIRNLFCRFWVLLKQLAMSSSRSVLHIEGSCETEYTFKVRFITDNNYNQSGGEPLVVKVGCPKEFSLPEISVPIRLKFNDTFEPRDFISPDLMMAMLNGMPKLIELKMGCHRFSGKHQFLTFFYSSQISER